MRCSCGGVAARATTQLFWSVKIIHSIAKLLILLCHIGTAFQITPHLLANMIHQGFHIPWPELGGAVATGGGQSTAIGAELDGQNRIAVAVEGGDQGALASPEFGGAVVTGGRYTFRDMAIRVLNPCLK